MIVRGLLGAAALVTASSIGIALAAGLPVAADDVTVVRIPGAVPAKTCTIGAVADTFVDEALPDTVFGAEPYVEVASGQADRRALVRFDVGSCGIPAGAEVRSARLTMVLAAAPAVTRTWRVRRVTSAWSEPAATWTTSPTVGPAITDEAETGTVVGAALEWNVRADVADVVSGAATDRGWRIADADEDAPVTISGALGSREAPAADHRPSLTLVWFD